MSKYTQITIDERLKKKIQQAAPNKSINQILKEQYGFSEDCTIDLEEVIVSDVTRQELKDMVFELVGNALANGYKKRALWDLIESDDDFKEMLDRRIENVVIESRY